MTLEESWQEAIELTVNQLDTRIQVVCEEIHDCYMELWLIESGKTILINGSRDVAIRDYKSRISGLREQLKVYDDVLGVKSSHTLQIS